MGAFLFFLQNNDISPYCSVSFHTTRQLLTHRTTKLEDMRYQYERVVLALIVICTCIEARIHAAKRHPHVRVRPKHVQTTENEPTADSVIELSKRVFGYESAIIDPDLFTKYRHKFALLPTQTFAFDDSDLLNQFNEKFKTHIDEASSMALTMENNGMIPLLDQTSIWAITMVYRPRLVVEIGAGFSSYVFAKAMDACRLQGGGCRSHVAVEPFRSQVLESLDGKVEVIKKPLQEVELEYFGRLKANDVLFIDSSHVTTPYGDVVYEYLFILPTLKPGVIVHVHDIFLPHDYAVGVEAWMHQRRSYTEQWLLAAFLHKNDDWKVLWSSFYMSTNHSKLLPPGIGHGGSFWMQKMR